MPKISELTVTTGLTTGDYFVIVQGGNSRKIKIDDFYASINLGIQTTAPGGDIVAKNAVFCALSSGNNTAYSHMGWLNTPTSADSEAVLMCYSFNNDFTSGHYILSINSSSLQVYFEGLISAASVVDRTPSYVGDALTELSAIQEKDGAIDHQTLPTFIRKDYTKFTVDAQGKSIATPETGRSLGGSISMLITAVQQLSDLNKERVIAINNLTCSLNALDGRLKAIEAKAI